MVMVNLHVKALSKLLAFENIVTIASIGLLITYSPGLSIVSFRFHKIRKLIYLFLSGDYSPTFQSITFLSDLLC